MGPFQVGDRVQCIEPQRKFTGQIGTVVSLNEYKCVRVLFPDYSPLPQNIREISVRRVAAPAPSIPGDDTLADDNSAAEQRAEWADYGLEIQVTHSLSPDSELKRRNGWRLVSETFVMGSLWPRCIWHRYLLLSADYA